MNWLPNSIRWRIQLWHGILLLVVLIAFGTTAYHFQYSNEIRQLDADLRMKLFILHNQLAQGPEGGPKGEPRGPKGQPREGDRSRPRDERERRPEDDDEEREGEDKDRRPGEGARQERGPNLLRNTHIANIFVGDSYFTIWHREGKMMDRSPNAPEFTEVPPRTEVPELRSRNGWREAYEFTPPGECLLVGISEAGVHADMKRFMLEIVSYGGLLLVLGLLGGGWLAARAIAPIRDISRAASRIAKGHLAERIPAAKTENELGQLSGLLNETFDRLAHLVEEQKRFTSDAAHELRTPVAIILAQTQLALSRDREGGADRKTIEMTRRSAERMQNLIESLLILATADSDDNMPRDFVPLDELCRDNVDLIRPLAEEKGIILLEELKPTSALAFGEHVDQILTNLLSNAVKYCRAGDEVNVTTREENGFAIIVVEDRGPGIAPEHLPHLFDRFYRAEASRNRNSGGAGLGLAICKILVEAQGGTIRVDSEVGGGTTFTVSFPDHEITTSNQGVLT